MSGASNLSGYVQELSSWDWVAIVALCFVLVNMLRRRLFRPVEPVPEPVLPPMKRRGRTAIHWCTNCGHFSCLHALKSLLGAELFKICQVNNKLHHSITKLHNTDFYTEELVEYDGRRPDGRLLLAVDGQVFDMTRAKDKYGVGGPYNILTGRDASRCFANFDLQLPRKTEYDDLADVQPSELATMREWAADMKSEPFNFQCNWRT
jgi:predicted heme/steroid binding protein